MISELGTGYFDAYGQATLALGAFGALFVIQSLVADAISIRSKHTPGHPPPGDHDDFHFRAVRAVHNTVETAGLFLVVLAFAVLRGASPDTVALWSWIFVGARAAYALCYWFDLRILRSTVFTVGLVALVALLVIGI